jgi:hypothetical protein
VITEVSANFAHHGWYGESQEICAVLGIISVDRLNQPHPRHLSEVFERFSAVSEPACDVVGQGQTAFDDHVSLAPVLGRPLVQRRKPTQHGSHVGIVGPRS